MLTIQKLLIVIEDCHQKIPLKEQLDGCWRLNEYAEVDVEGVNPWGIMVLITSSHTFYMKRLRCCHRDG
jgi:hypothetical protein